MKMLVINQNTGFNVYNTSMPKTQSDSCISNVPNFGHLEKSKISLLALANVKNVKVLGAQAQFLSCLLMGNFTFIKVAKVRHIIGNDQPNEIEVCCDFNN